MKLEGDFSSVLEFNNPFEGAKYERLKKTLLSLMLGQKDALFEKSQDPNGTGWVKLSQKALARRMAKTPKKKRNIEPKILVDTGALRNSLTDQSNPYGLRDTSADEVKLGTNVPYAAIHNYGGVINHPGTKNGFGIGVEIKPYKITIPPRPFMGFGNEDSSRVSETIEHYMESEANK